MVAKFFRPLCALVLCAGFLISPPSAQAATRDEFIGDVVATYTRSFAGPFTSSFLKEMKPSIRNSNPGVSDKVLEDIANEVAPALVAVLAKRGGVLDTGLRQALAPLSDEELAHIASLLMDPVYLKFQAAISSPQVANEMAKALGTSALIMHGVINSVLAKHGLKGIH